MSQDDTSPVHYFSNGTEQGLWMERWCERCARDDRFRAGIGDGCDHALNIIVTEPDAVFSRDADDQLVCSAFILTNEAALVVLDPEKCPVDGTTLGFDGMDEPALFKHGGYGAMRRTVLRCCPKCGWSITREVSEVSPR